MGLNLNIFHIHTGDAKINHKEGINSFVVEAPAKSVRHWKLGRRIICKCSLSITGFKGIENFVFENTAGLKLRGW